MGQWRPSEFGNLADRVAGGKQARSSVPLPTHVSVVVDGRMHPGILLEWVRVEPGWAGRVVWASPGGHVHVEVLESGSITPVHVEDR